MSYFISTVYYQLLAYSRAKQAVFYTVAFPIMLFVIFSSLWGGVGEAYLDFLLTGVIGMTVASQGLFSFGPIIKSYHRTNLIKIIKILPHSPMINFAGMLFCRFLVILLSILLLFGIGIALFKYQFIPVVALRILGGAVLGILLFSSLGLLIAFWSNRDDGNRGIINLIYFIMIFTSDTFYPVTHINEAISFWTRLLPLTPILAFMRGDVSIATLSTIAFWILIPSAIFTWQFTRNSIDR